MSGFALSFLLVDKINIRLAFCWHKHNTRHRFVLFASLFCIQQGFVWCLLVLYIITRMNSQGQCICVIPKSVIGTYPLGKFGLMSRAEILVLEPYVEAVIAIFFQFVCACTNEVFAFTLTFTFDGIDL